MISAPMISAALTDVGRKRQVNEDGFGSFPELGLHLVVDGLGAYEAVPIAALVVRVARSSYADAEPGAAGLVAALEAANRAVAARAATEPAWRGGGATVVGMALTPGEAHLAHVGDCRAYRVRRRVLERLTEDHSLLNAYLKAHRPTPQEIADFPHKNCVMRAIGLKADVAVDVRTVATQKDDRLLLCTDGLHGTLGDPRISAILDAAWNVDQAVADLVAAANDAGGPDNITALLVRIT